MTTNLWSEDTPARLLASCHRETGEVAFPPLPAHSPIAHQYEPYVLQSHGTLYSFTIIHPSPKSGLAPFALGYLDLPGPVRLFGRVNAKRRPAIGDTCQVVADATYGYAFELLETAQ
ncbi:Zn-ribbon domain-containing OB-fold protein [Pseudomonas sp. NPDC089554]|uniref:Zn-ribbon domain-containing OB-fold protein n=1 Tax=Pseudomonas sp. NPDC089554 TaxID=3390653 RepID=UPI003CFF712E